jgi:hypothetical protein
MRGPLGANTKKWHDTMNYAHDDYVMGHLLRFARASNRDTLIIDLMTGEADPTVLIQPPIEEVPWSLPCLAPRLGKHPSKRYAVRPGRGSHAPL